MEDSFRVGVGGIQHKGIDEGRKETGPLAGINGLMKEKLDVMAPSSALLGRTSSLALVLDRLISTLVAEEGPRPRVSMECASIHK